MPVEPDEEILNIYRELVDDVREREARLEEDLLDGEPSYNIHKSLEKPIERWRNGRKTLRSGTVIPVYEEYLGEDLPRPLKKALIGMDANINVLDDIIDTRDLDRDTKIDLTAVAAFSGAFTWPNIPPEYMEEVQEVTTQYLTELFQIPLVEDRKRDAIRDASSEDDVMRPAEESYRYRARDMDAFAKIPATAYDIDAGEYDTLIDDLRSFRARELLMKDLQDVERDLEDQDITPVTLFLERHDSPDEVVRRIEDLYDRFRYTDDTPYRATLSAYNLRPDDLHGRVNETMDLVQHIT